MALALLLVVANGLLAILQLTEQRRADEKVERTFQVTLLLDKIEQLVTRCGRDQRSYRISGDVVRLEAYRQEAAALSGLLAQLRGLVADNKREDAGLNNIEALIDDDLNTLAKTLSPLAVRFQDGKLPQDLNESIDRSVAIASMLDDMAAGEAASLQAQLRMMRMRNSVMLGVVGFGAFIGVILLVVIVILLRRETRQTRLLAAASTFALRESEQRFRRIFEESPLGIVLVRLPDLEVIQANPAFCRMMGYLADQLHGRSIADMTHVNDRELLLRSAKQVGESSREVEVRFVTGSAVLAWGHIGLSQLGPSDSHPNLLLALVEDITREKRVEAELRQAQKMEAIGQLTGGIAHDFNNLLGVIIGNAEFMLDAVQDDAAIGNMAQEILDTALSGADLTRRLLAFASRQTLQPRQINLNAYLPNHVATIRRVLGETIQVSVSLANDLWPTRADPSQVHDALLNLAINARDAMPHGGRIRISTANVHLEAREQTPDVAQGDYVVLSVADTGIGMPPEVLERAMEPFFTTKGPGAGSGLGLSMIFGFARQSGGHLAIDSQPGVGTTVLLYLPRAAEVTPDDDQTGTGSTMPLGRESVLLVDDNAEMRAIARQHLISLGYRVREAENGPLAMECLRGGQRFDLLFTDIIMPDGMMGYQLAAGARQMQPGLKVLFTTGYARPAVTTEESEAPSGPVLRKPYRKQDLATAVRAALDS
ncbi:MAG TPA: ATP-binding protein [Acetobacteraceae bacterium]|nr:ATP-binding protein [Acetobacteraceae bacterium]